MKSVNEVCKLAGVSRRTLQYYDEIGLLPPSAVKESGYRQYDDESLRRLWSILFYKELGLSLDDIRLILENPKEMEIEIMRRHKQILLEKQTRLQKMILSVDRMLNDDFAISMLRDFDKNKIEKMKKTYANEIRALTENKFFLPVIKSGILPNRGTMLQSASSIMFTNIDEFLALCAEVMQRFHSALADDPEGLAAQKAVAVFVELINRCIPCDDSTFIKIAQSYLIYKEELDQKTPGLAEFVYKAISYVYH